MKCPTTEIGAEAEAGIGGEAMVNTANRNNPKRKKEKRKKKRAVKKSKSRILVGAVCSVLANPIVLMVLLGLLYNVVFSRSMPQWFDQLVTTLGRYGSETTASPTLYMYGCSVHVGLYSCVRTVVFEYLRC